MEEGQERDDSVVEQGHIIDDDDDDEDSAADTPDLWMPDRNEEDTKFVRPSTDAIPTKKHPQSVSELSIVQQRKKLFKELVKGGLDTQTVSLGDQYLRDKRQHNCHTNAAADKLEHVDLNVHHWGQG